MKLPEFMGPCLGNNQHLIDTPLLRSSCARCAQSVLKCHVGGMPTRLAPQVITLEQEILAIRAGLATFEIISRSTWLYAIWRDDFRIRLDAKNGRPDIVMTQHPCLGRTS